MDLTKIGKLLCNLRKAKGMTQKEVADRLGVVPKTISKWETGRGFPDVSMLSALAEVLGVNEKVLLAGDLLLNKEEAGNMKRTKFYVCPCCGSFMQGTGEAQLVCCSKPLMPLTAQTPDDAHMLNAEELENDFYIEFRHEMTKAHSIGFVSYVGFDRTLTVRLYPEQDASVRFTQMYGGTLYYYCTEHGLFACKINKKAGLGF